MADKKENLAETASDTSREERLESARRKYEEMKKKKKSKKKNDKNEDGDNKISTEEGHDSDFERKKEEKKEEEKKEVEKKEEEKKEEEKKEVEKKEEEKKEVEKKEEEKKEQTRIEPSEQTHDTEQFKSLHLKIQERDSTIRKLSSENIELIQAKHILENRITELEKRIQQLSFARDAKDVSLIDNVKSLSQEYVNEYSDKRTAPQAGYDFRENLMAWEGWQVDMRNWNQSSKFTQVIL